MRFSTDSNMVTRIPHLPWAYKPQSTPASCTQAAPEPRSAKTTCHAQVHKIINLGSSIYLSFYLSFFLSVYLSI